MFLFHRQQLNLLVECPCFVEIGRFDDVPDFLQEKLELAEQQHLLQSLELRLAVKPIPRIGPRRRMQQADVVVMLQRAHANARQLADFMHRQHDALLSSWLHYEL